MTTTTFDPVNAPSHYCGSDGLWVRDITRAYGLGPDLTQAVQYIIRAGRKTTDARSDLAKAVKYLRWAAEDGRTGKSVLFCGAADINRPSVAHVLASFAIDGARAEALRIILNAEDSLSAAADVLDAELGAHHARPHLSLAASAPPIPVVRLPVTHRESA